VVLLLSLSLPYQRFRYEVDLKYDDRDIVSSSIVFRSSKWNGASGNPLLEFFYKPKLNLLFDCKLKNKKRKRLPVANERCVLSREMFPATNTLKVNVILSKNF
jgi:hypothetical protein